MNASSPFIGIDFGTSKCVMARFDPDVGRAEVILNYERKPLTPSLVYFDKNGGEVLVGERAENKLRQGNVEQRGFVMSVKRNLITASAKVVGDKLYRPVDVAAKILQKLREDAEKVQFHQPVTRAVITYPASFDALLQDKIRQAAILAGFIEVELLAEPVAAALAYVQTGNEVENYILVYDFGGGTFDVAVLSRIPDGSFALALEPKGFRDCGGDDLDRELYYYCEELALQTLKRRISLTDDLDLPFLRHCRDRKENLSYEQECTFSDPLPSNNGVVLFEHTVSRAMFEQRIRKYIEHTANLTQEVMREADARNRKIDTVVLIGGSSSVPLVYQLLAGTLPVQPKEWQYRDYAVALGAAYHARYLWGRGTSSSSTGQATKKEEYRQAVQSAWAGGRLTRAQLDDLSGRVSSLGLSAETAATIEREVMGDTKEVVFERHGYADLAEYRTLVARAWMDKTLTQQQAQDIAERMRELGLSRDQAEDIEREVMGDTAANILARRKETIPPPPPPTPTNAPKKASASVLVILALVLIAGGLITSLAVYNGQQANSQATATAQSDQSTQDAISAQQTSDVQATQAAQPTYPNVQGSYSGNYQFSNSPGTINLNINSQNGSLFTGTIQFDNQNPLSIDNGTVDTGGNITFSVTGTDQYGNTVTLTFTGNAQSSGGWQGTFTDSNGDQGSWSAS